MVNNIKEYVNNSLTHKKERKRKQWKQISAIKKSNIRKKIGKLKMPLVE